MNPALWTAAFPVGWLYCDKTGPTGLHPVAQLRYDTLQLVIFDGASALLPDIRANAAAMQANRGQLWSLPNMVARLGWRLKPTDPIPTERTSWQTTNR
jgi:hypothetical protein